MMLIGGKNRVWFHIPEVFLAFFEYFLHVILIIKPSMLDLLRRFFGFWMVEVHVNLTREWFLKFCGRLRLDYQINSSETFSGGRVMKLIVNAAGIKISHRMKLVELQQNGKFTTMHKHFRCLARLGALS